MNPIVPTSRRHFIKTAAATVATFNIVPRHVLGGPRFVPPSEKLNVAIIGTGGQGRTNVRALMQLEDAQIIAVADPAESFSLENFYFKGMGGRMPVKAEIEKHYAEKTPNFRCADYVDFREMLEKEKSIDAVLIATPDHLHAYASVIAMRAGKHVYCEKPIATNLNEAVEIARLAQASGLKHGAVQDKLFLPGLRKLDMLRRAGFFGKMLSVRLEFGYWVFEGDLQPIQRPSWNYRAEDGGGMILDMMCHWRYVLDNLFGEVKSVSCMGTTHIPQRWDEAGKPYACTADDAAYATAELTGHGGEPVIAQMNMSWATRVRRDDLVTFHVDGTHGSAVAGLSDCRAQSRVNTPRPVWNPDQKQTMNFFDQWQEVPDTQVYDNGFKIQWEHFIRHVVENEPYKWTLPEGAKGVQLVEAALQSWKERRWVDVPALKV